MGGNVGASWWRREEYKTGIFPPHTSSLLSPEGKGALCVLCVLRSSFRTCDRVTNLSLTALTDQCLLSAVSMVTGLGLSMGSQEMGYVDI